MVCDALHLQVTAGQPGVRDAQVLSLSLLKLDPSRLMAVLGDVTQSVKRDRALRHSQAWINALVTGIADYALVPLDGSGCVQLWNPGIERVTGLTQLATLGHPFSVFYPPDSVPHERVLDRLHEADNNGWSLDEGWCLRADGTRYWGSCLIAPLRPSDEAPAGEHAYSRSYATFPTAARPAKRCASRSPATTSPGWLTGAPSSRRPSLSCNVGGACHDRYRW